VGPEIVSSTELGRLRGPGTDTSKVPGLMEVKTGINSIEIGRPGRGLANFDITLPTCNSVNERRIRRIQMWALPARNLCRNQW
jgi:hypothetical protein